MRRYKPDTLLLIVWRDIVEDPAWQTVEQATTLPLEGLCCSVGFFNKHDKECLYLSNTVSNSERNSLVIPLGCIKIYFPILDLKVLRALINMVK